MLDNVILGMAVVVLLGVLGAIWMAQPDCRPGEVRVRGMFGVLDTRCVVGR